MRRRPSLAKWSPLREDPAHERLRPRVRGDLRPAARGGPERRAGRAPPRAGRAGVGRVLEIGAGTGLNLEYYGDAVTDLVLTEPEEPMARRLRQRVQRGEVVEAPAERLPFPDDAFDTVVSTLVLCTVPDQPGALAEVRRVLKPGGRMLFLEHVRASDPDLAKWQDRLMRPWRVIGYGCHCNRDTAAEMTRAGFRLDLQPWRLPKAPAIVRPVIEGVAIAG
jgi:SAM-dependent methyltransferase